MLAGNKPDDLADLTFGIVSGQACKSVWIDLFVFCQLCRIFQCCSFSISKEGTRVILFQSVEFGLIHRCFDRGPAADIDAERTDVYARHPLSDEEGSLLWQYQFFIQLVNLRNELTKGRRHTRKNHFHRCKHSAKSPACHSVGQHHDQPVGFFDWRKERFHTRIHLPLTNILNRRRSLGLQSSLRDEEMQ